MKRKNKYYNRFRISEMNSRKELWILLATFLLPILLGSGFYFLNPNYFTQNTLNYGQLVRPIIAFNTNNVTFTQGTVTTLQRKWVLAYTTDNCDNKCTQIIKDMKTIKTLMNDEMRRLKYILLTTIKKSIQDKNALVAQPNMALKKQLGKFPKKALFLIDPIGNIMLYYNIKNLNIKLIVKDLQRLFKYSRIG